MSSTRRTIFLEGPAGSGKTTRGINHLKVLLDEGIHPGRILLLTPQRTYAAPYLEALKPMQRHRIGRATIGGLARRTVSLFWPYIVEKNGFSPSAPPVFLTLETAQFFMSRVVDPLIEQGYFADLTITLPRLYSQLIDNLNKAAVNGFSIAQVTTLLSSMGTSPMQALLSEDITKSIEAFRAYCIQNNLLDFSLYLGLFHGLIQTEPKARYYLFDQYDHLIADNVEEDIPITHNLIGSWLPRLQSALIIYDTDAGFRRYLGADSASALQLRERCGQHTVLDTIHTTPDDVRSLSTYLTAAANGKSLTSLSHLPPASLSERLLVTGERLHHTMVNQVIKRVVLLVKEKRVSPEEIAVISPFLTDSLRHTLSAAFDRAGIPFHIHHSSRGLGDESVTKVLLTLATLAHPAWQERISREAVGHMLAQVLADCDIIRAHLLTELFQPHGETTGLGRFEDIEPSKRTRITNMIGQYYNKLRQWLIDYSQEPEHPIDYFFCRLFSEILSQKGFGFYQNVPSGIRVANVIESARKFRQACFVALDESYGSVGQAYYKMVQRGVISALYLGDRDSSLEAVRIAPAYTFLLQNRPVRYQLWLDVGSSTWYQRINQPLTNPYILSRDWSENDVWDDATENRYETERLDHLVRGLLLRCTGTIHLFYSELSPYGQEQNGRLLGIFHSVLGYLNRHHPPANLPARDV